MNKRCRELEETLLDGDFEGNAELARHSEECLNCRERVRAWRELAAAAQSLRRAWESPGLWPRIAQALAEESSRVSDSGRDREKIWSRLRFNRLLAGAACTAVLVLSLGFGWLLFWNDHSQPTRAVVPRDPEFDRRILTEQALKEVEESERKYVQSIDRLSAVADPLLEKQTTPILLNYRERLMLLDEAIADCRANIELNRSNAHLRRELVSIYQEKQHTLENLLKEKINEPQ